MVVQAVSASRGDNILVVMIANRNKESMDAVDWALKHVVRRGDTVIVLGLAGDFGKKNSCFPLNMGISISGIWERLEFSSQGQGEARPRELGEEIERKRLQYQTNLQPFYRQCRKNEVKLEVKLAFGFCPPQITVEQARKSKPRWIVLDRHLKKYKLFIHANTGCKIALMKGKDVATLMQPRAPLPPNSPENCKRIDNAAFPKSQPEDTKNALDTFEKGEPSTLPLHPESPCWYPLSWRSGFPRAFSQSELEVITNGFSEENMFRDKDGIQVYEGVLQDTPVLVNSFSDTDERFWTMLKILSRVRHRNIMNLVGYCCTGTSMFLLSDFPCMGTLEFSLKYDESARNLPWKARWYIALEIGGCLRYLHEECADGAIVHLSVCSAHVVFYHGCSPMLSNFITARWLKDDIFSDKGTPEEWANLEADERLSIDVHDYGMFLIELISGKSAQSFQNQSKGQTLIDWALPLLENGPLSEVLDSRLEDISDSRLVHLLANAALLCLKNDSGHRFSMSEVLAVVRGDQLAMAKRSNP